MVSPQTKTGNDSLSTQIVARATGQGLVFCYVNSLFKFVQKSRVELGYYLCTNPHDIILTLGRQSNVAMEVVLKTTVHNSLASSTLALPALWRESELARSLSRKQVRRQRHVGSSPTLSAMEM